MASCSFNEPILKSGDKGNAVELLQTCLEGYFVVFGASAPGLVGPGPIDGDFGPLTEASLKSFQATIGQGPVDGIAGPITWSQLDVADKHFPGVDLNKGDSGNPVRHLQRLLF